MRVPSRSVILATLGAALAAAFAVTVPPAHATPLALGGAGTDETAVASPARPTRVALFRPADGTWLLREADGSASSVSCGGADDEPVPADYEGTGYAQIALFRRATGEWLLRAGTGKSVTIPFGAAEDVPVPEDYWGEGKAQLAVFRPSMGSWIFRREDGTQTVVPFGAAGDVAVPADYLGTGALQLAVYRPSTGLWAVRTPEGGSLTVMWGAAGDLPVPADYDGVGHAEVAVYRPSTGQWIVHQGNGTGRTVQFGGPGDQAVPGDYLGLGCAQMAVYRPGTGQWFVRTPSGETLTVAFGEPRDLPVTVRFAPAFGAWHVRSSGIREAGGCVVRGAAEWQVLWQSLHAAEAAPAPAPEIDFDRAMILAVFMGERPTSGYGIAIAEVAAADGELRVSVREQVPAEGAISAQVLTQPACLVLVPKSDLPVRFLLRTEARQ